MGELEEYLNYLDQIWSGLVKHFSDKSVPLTETRVKCYFELTARPFYYWKEEGKQPAGQPGKPPEEKKEPASGAGNGHRQDRPATIKQVGSIRQHLDGKKGEDIRRYMSGLGVKSVDDLSITEASHILDFCYGKVNSL